MTAFLEQYQTVPKPFPSLQEEAIRHFNRLGLPTPKHEEWKYTNIGPIASRTFNLPGRPSAISKEWLLSRLPFLKDSAFAVLENGQLNTEASVLGQLEPGLSVRKLSEVSSLPEIKKHFNLYVDVREDAFAALNTAFANDGLVIQVAGQSDLKKPFFVINIGCSAGEAVISHNRLLVLCGKNSSAVLSNIVISGSDTTETFANSQVEVFIDENASLELDVLQDENLKSYHINGTHVYQSANSRFLINTVALGGSILRNKLHIKLDGPGSEAHMHGLYVATGSQLIDNHTAVYHAVPHCNSNELYKGIVGGKAHGVFNGKIMVEKDAQKTNAYQSNKNILLSDDAVVNAKPQLEIFADDVKCTHGATTGQMDDDALFYLRSRGINESHAKALLNLAFANDILEPVSTEPLRNYISSLVESKLKEAL